MKNKSSNLVQNVNNNNTEIKQAKSESEKLKPNSGRKSSKSNDKYVAPDGGWAWVVAVATGMSIFVTYPVLFQFGVLFREKFANQGINSSQITTIMNAQHAVAMCSGLINGPLFRCCSHRQVSIIGNLFVFVGLFATIFANSFIAYIISISLLYGTGRGILFSTMVITISTYFKEKRQAATALQYAIGGAGPIFLSHIITFLVGYYGVAGTVLLLCGLSLNNFACSATYQPIKWHLKKVPHQPPHQEHDSDSAELDLKSCKLEINTKFKSSQTSLEEKEEMLKTVKNSSSDSSMLQKIVIMFDLDLLKDFGYINLVSGLTLINFIHLNQIYLMPFILHEFKLDKDTVATSLTIEATFQLVAKLLVVFVVAKIKWENKTWLMFGNIAVIVGRIALLSTRNYIVIELLMIWVGLFSGLSLVFMLLVLPCYVPLDRLPGALGLQRLIMGICFLVLGPLIGLIRDATNYFVVLHIMNVIVGAVIIVWLCEDFYRKRCRRKQVDKLKNVA